MRTFKFQIHHLYTTPPPAYQITSEPELMYVHLLFALKDRNLGMVEANFANLVFTAFTFMENNWDILLKDIENGTIDQKWDIPAEVRRQLDLTMKPDPQRAQELRKALEENKSSFNAICEKIWPDLHTVLCTTTGTMQVYHDLLKSTYLGDGEKSPKCYSPIYGATEGLLGVNLRPYDPESSYVLMPRAQFFEFIPVSDNTTEQEVEQVGDEKVEPKTLLATELEKDKDYEVVVTNNSGLYRYRLGDVVRVKGYFNEIPVVEVRYRLGQLLNVRGEKISEELFYKVLSEVASEKGLKIRDYTTVESPMLGARYSSPFYKVFLELASDSEEDPKALMPALSTLVEAKLREEHFVYKSFRNKGSIGPLRITIVPKNTFTDFRGFMLEKSEASKNQLKVPRVLKSKDFVSYFEKF